MIRIAWEETTTDHPLKGIAVRIGFRNLNLGVWILGLGFWILEFGFLILVPVFFFWILKPGSSVFWGLDFGVLILGVWILEVLDCWFLSFIFGRFYGSEVVSLGRFWRRCLGESEGKPLQTLQSRKWSCFCAVFFGKIHGSEVVGVEGSGGDTCESLGGNHCRHHFWEMLLSLFWFPFLSLFGGLGGHQGVWSGFLVRFMGNMIRIAWEETTTDHPLQGIAVRIGFRNLNLGVWILGLGFWILEFGFLILVPVFFLDFETWIFGVLGLGFWSVDFGLWIFDFGSWGSWSWDFGILILEFGF